MKRAFQALRIAVNQEVLNLEQFLQDCPTKFLDTSREASPNSDYRSLLLMITFHSIEERLVSQAMAVWKKQKLGQHGTSKPLQASEIELAENQRSRSAKLYSFIFH
jgi:16S rRNA (cytosine1402-N4)-methyltransferase